MRVLYKHIIITSVCLGLASCSNDPYRPGESSSKTYFTFATSEPSKLDPATSYYSHEAVIIDNVCETPYQYHFLKRPYEVIPLMAESMPAIEYLDDKGKPIDDKDPPASKISKVAYTIKIKKGIKYQNHPCFAKKPDGTPYYTDTGFDAIKRYEYPSDFPVQSTREVTAADFALQIRRIADPRLASPVFSVIETVIDGHTELQKEYIRMLDDERKMRRQKAGAGYNQEKDERDNPIILDYMKPAFPGVQVIDEHTYRIMVKRKYPQLLYWLCMHFFCPTPQESIDFYELPAIKQKQFSINNAPVGSGAFYINRYRPHEKVELVANPNYHDDFYPSDGMPEDRGQGLLKDAGRKLPLIDRAVIRLEKEAIPSWNKFIQGYYDISSISADVFNQAINVQSVSDPSTTDSMKDKGINLVVDTEPRLFYTGFNMLDDVVGGYTEERRKLRHAISIALDYNEYLNIFMNGRGVAAQGPLPPGMFGYKGGENAVNKIVNEWDPETKKPRFRSLETAKQLLAEAGYPGGRDKNGVPLTLFLDHSESGKPDFRSEYEWMKTKLEAIGIKLKERATDLSRFREKVRTGNWQVCRHGWYADYPDPENFMFLFYGPNSKTKTDGNNLCNYNNSEYDRMFLQMETMINCPERQDIIDKMVDTLQTDAPCSWGYFRIMYILKHKWIGNMKPHQMMTNTLRFRNIDSQLRTSSLKKWNRPVYWPMIAVLFLISAVILPGAYLIYRRERRGY
jgi:ABC-type transport system substrate-binding protein